MMFLTMISKEGDDPPGFEKEGVRIGVRVD
jgi:hypothetical protein